jgi:hypothetical protein
VSPPPHPSLALPLPHVGASSPKLLHPRTAVDASILRCDASSATRKATEKNVEILFQKMLINILTKMLMEMF